MELELLNSHQFASLIVSHMYCGKTHDENSGTQQEALQKKW